MRRLLKKMKNNDVSKNVIGIFTIKAISLCVSFFSMPLYLKYFQDDSVLGAWYTLLSIVNWIYIFDFGMGNSLRNKLVKSIEQKQYDETRSYIETSYTIIGIIGSIIVIVALIGIALVDINKMLDVSSEFISPNEFKKAVAILAIGIVGCFSLKTINAVLFAFQKAAVTSFSTLVSSIAMLLFILFYNNANQSEAFLILSIVHAVAITLPLLVTTIVVFSTNIGKKIRPHRPNCKKEKVKDLLTLGLGFFAIQLMILFVISTNELMITSFFGSSVVVEYSIYHKVFNMASSVFILAVTPVWSKITQYIVKKDIINLKKIYRLLMICGCAATCLIFLIIPLLQTGFNLWLRENTIKVNYIYALVFAIYTVAYVFSILLTTVANGAGRLKTQLIFYGMAAIVKIPLILTFSKLGMSWISVMLAVVIPLLLLCIAQHFSNQTFIKQLK